MCIAVITATAKPGQSPPVTQCDFDSGTLCTWTQDSTDQMDWIIHQSNTGTTNTGPPYDHTTSSDKGTQSVYVLLEMSTYLIWKGLKVGVKFDKKNVLIETTF